MTATPPQDALIAAIGGLNEAQAEAVFAAPGPTMVIAGAGSGKTRVLTARVAHQVSAGCLDPDKAFVTAFTKTAATEMQERIRRLGVDVPVSTFHSLMWRFVTGERRLRNLPPVTVCTDGERATILKGLCGKPGKPGQAFAKALDLQDVDVSQVGRIISTWKNHLYGPENPPRPDEAPRDVDAAVAVYDLYEDELFNRNKIDFEDMLVHAWKYLTGDQSTLARARSMWTGFHVDEAQDTNPAQWKLIELLAPPEANPNITIVGDPRQAIFQFRGAEPELFEDFQTRYPAARRIDMTVNYRSREPVVAAANNLITGIGLPDLTSARGPGYRVETNLFFDETHQAAWIANLAATHRMHGGNGSEIAVLVRTNAQLARIEQALVAAEVPYWCRGGGFFHRLEVADLTAYMRLALTRTDTAALSRIVNRPTRYLGKAFVDAVTAEAGHGGDLITAMRRVRETRGKTLNSNQIGAAATFAGLLEAIVALPPVEAIDWVLRVGGYEDWLTRELVDFDADTATRNDNITALIDLAAGSKTVAEFIAFADEAELAQADHDDAVELSTIHSAKGQEWSTVIVAGCSDGLLPHKRADIDHERRLAYVAFTRAQNHLIVASVATDHDGEPLSPSPFIAEAGLEPTGDEDGGQGDDAVPPIGESGQPSEAPAGMDRLFDL